MIGSQLLRNDNRKPYALYRTVTFPKMTFSDLWRSFSVATLCALLTRDLLVIVKFVVYYIVAEGLLHRLLVGWLSL